jgi:hypothetical protein
MKRTYLVTSWILLVGLWLFPQMPAHAFGLCATQSTDLTDAAQTPALDRKSTQRRVVRNGGTTDPSIQFLPSQSPEQARQQIAGTQILLSAAERNLNQVASRKLDTIQQQDVSQLRNYLRQARASLEAGNLDRAYILARKANVLTTDMIKR